MSRCIALMAGYGSAGTYVARPLDVTDRNPSRCHRPAAQDHAGSVQGGLDLETLGLAILAAVVGAAFCFFGYRFFLLLLPLWGFVAGFVAGMQGVGGGLPPHPPFPP